MDWDDATRNRMPMDFGDGGCQKRVNVWKQANAELQHQFNTVVRQRDAVFEQRDAWVATIRQLFAEGKVNASKDEVNAIYKKIEERMLKKKGLNDVFNK